MSVVGCVRASKKVGFTFKCKHDSKLFKLFFQVDMIMISEASKIKPQNALNIVHMHC